MNVSPPIHILSLAKVKGQKATGLMPTLTIRRTNPHPLQLKYHNRL